MYYLTIILRAPKGVTRMAGANAYAAKFAISPKITAKGPQNKNSVIVIYLTF